MAEQQEAVVRKDHRVRSPAYPAIGLEEAIRRAEQVYQKEHAHPTAIDVVLSHWGYKPKTGPGGVTLAALKQFGLLEQPKEGDATQVLLSQMALRIIQDEIQDSPERLDAIQLAALTPKIYAEMWEKWGPQLPSDPSIRTYLVMDRSYNRSSVAALIKDYKNTIAFAKLKKEDILSDDGGDKPPVAINVGAYVQWTSQGQIQFSKPGRVTGLSEDGNWAFVEGTKSGLPIEELTIVQRVEQVMKTPPSNPDYQPLVDIALALPVIMDGGIARNVDIPRMSEAAFNFFKQQLDVYRDVIIKRSPDEPIDE